MLEGAYLASLIAFQDAQSGGRGGGVAGERGAQRPGLGDAVTGASFSRAGRPPECPEFPSLSRVAWLHHPAAGSRVVLGLSPSIKQDSENLESN